MFPFKYSRTSQPQAAVGVDWGNPLTKSLVFASTGENTRDAVSGTLGVLGAGTTAVITQRGRALKGNTSVSSIGRWANSRLVTSTGNGLGDFSIVLRTNPVSNVGVRGTLFTNIATSTYENTGLFSNASATGSYSSGSMLFGTYNAGWEGVAVAGGVDGTSNIWCGVRRGAYLSLYKNGILVAGPTLVTIKNIYKAGQVLQLMGDSENSSYPGFTAETPACWNRALSEAEVKSLSANPWQIFAPITRPIWVPATTVVSISRPTADVTTTGWTGNPDNVTLYTNINETVASDTSYITSPTITGGGDPTVYDFLPTKPAGTWAVNTRAEYVGASAEVRVILLDGSNAVQGTSAWQTVTSSWVTYPISVTTTGTSSRVKVEVR